MGCEYSARTPIIFDKKLLKLCSFMGGFATNIVNSIRERLFAKIYY